MKILVASPADRDAVVAILARNGYTVRQGRQPKPGSKTVKESYVEYWREGEKRDANERA